MQGVISSFTNNLIKDDIQKLLNIPGANLTLNCEAWGPTPTSPTSNHQTKDDIKRTLLSHRSQPDTGLRGQGVLALTIT